MAVRAVGQAVVDLVAVDEQVVADGDAGQLVLDRVGQDRAGRVARVAEEERLRPRRDRRLDGGRIEREVVLEPGRDPDRRPAGERDRRDVGDVRRLVEDHLVAGIAGRPQGEVDRLRGADGDEDLGRRVVADAVATVEVRRQRPAQLDRPVVARVVGPAAHQAGHAGLDDVGRRVEVGLADPEADDVVHRRQDVEEPADPGRRDVAHALAERPLGERRPIGGQARLGGHAREDSGPASGPVRRA